MITRRSTKRTASYKAMEAHEREAVAGARDSLARVIADGNHADRSRAIEATQAIDRGWRDGDRQYSVTYRLTRVYGARFELLGSFSEDTDTLPSTASSQMQTALYALDHLAHVLLTRLSATGVAIYPTMDTPEGEVRELPRPAKDTLLEAFEQDPADE